MLPTLPLGALEEKIRLTGAIDRIAKGTFILATKYQPSAFHGIVERLRHDPTWRVVELDCGHDIMVDKPRELVDVLLGVV